MTSASTPGDQKKEIKLRGERMRVVKGGNKRIEEYINQVNQNFHLKKGVSGLSLKVHFLS